MKRELAGMTLDQAAQWERDQREDVLRAAERGDISEVVFHSLLDNITDSYCAYLFAYAQGLVGRD